MSDDHEITNPEEKPEVYSVKQDEAGFSFSRREFLAATAAGTAAVAMAGAGMNALNQSAAEQAEAPDQEQMVMLEIDALGLLIAPLALGINRVWRITNQGKNSCPSSVLLFTAKHIPEMQQEIQVAEIAPGQTVEIPVSLPAPQTPGEYRYQWQLRIGNGAARMNDFILYAPDATLAESLHPYLASTNQTWTINNPDAGATSSYIHFSRLEVEDNFDNVYVKDGGGTIVQTLTGSYPSGLWSSKVSGNVVQVQLTSDSSIQEWGFLVDEVRTSLLVIYMPALHKARPTPTSYVICTCNTVEVCTCNLVCTCEAVCSCVGYCSCDTVCSCDGYCSCNEVCTCDTVHYWYPN